MLLHIQNPGASYTLPAREWKRIYHRRVKLTARSYVILRTMGPVDFVFDLSDTEPLEPQNDRIPDIVANPSPAKGQPAQGSLLRLIKNCAKVSIDVALVDCGTTLAGLAQRPSSRQYGFHITLNSKHTEAQQLGTLARELGHIFCGHLGGTENGFWRDNRGSSTHVEEFEAEAVAYLVTDRLNLDIGSASYLSGYLNSAKSLPDYSLDIVLTATGKIEEMVHGRFRVRQIKGAAINQSPFMTRRKRSSIDTRRNLCHIRT